MAGPELLSNVYEEAPDEIKLLQAKEEQVFGTIPVSRPSRTTLLQNHNRNIKDLAEGRLPPRSFILPAPYPPARTPIFEAERIYISQVQTAARKIDTVLYVRTIADPYVYSSSITIIEDEFGSAARLTVCNLDDTTHDPLLLNGSVLAIAQPCWSLAPGNDRHIRVDHPSDLVVLDPSLDSVPLAWRRRATKSELKDAATLRRDADVMFLKKRFRKALQIYDLALELSALHTDSQLQIDLLRKRCGVNLVLLRFEDAANDLSRAISTYTGATTHPLL